jgi:hypothetical protein
MQINGMNGVEALKEIVKTESSAKKMQILVISLVMAAFGAVASGMYMVRYINAMNIDSAFNDAAFPGLNLPFTKYYDIAFFASNDPADPKYGWSDDSAAAEYITDLSTDDQDTLMKGCRWSVLFGLNAFSLIFITINSTILAVGAYEYRARALGMVCWNVLGCLNIACIITTAVFRFNTIGKLAALSLAPSAYHDTLLLSDDRNYVMDGNWILWLWLFQVATFCGNCCSLGFLMKPPSGESSAMF